MTTLREPVAAPWLRPAVVVGASIHQRLMHRRFGIGASPVVAQEKVRRWLMENVAGTAFGRAHGIARGLSARAFAERVPAQPYEPLVPWIDRMKRGEADVLWPGRCAYYAVSSGTTQGRTKFLPVTPAMIAHFRRAGLDSLGLYARRRGSTAIFGGRQLFLGGSTTLAPLAAARPFPAWAGDLSGITARHLPAWAERCLYEPGRDIANLENWPEKIRAMAARTAGRDVRLLAGIPSWMLVFAEAMRAHTGRRTLAEIWPRFECLVHGGVPIAPFADELRSVAGEGVALHEVYPASEGFVAAQDADAGSGLRLFADAGIYYEFVPMARFDESDPARLGRDAVPLEGVACGVDYALVMTTPAGLCRYVIGDVVRFLSTQPPRLIYVGRTRLQLSAFGEHVIEKEVTDALQAVCARRDVVIGNFHVAPLFVDAARGRNRGCHEWWIELRSPGAAVLPAAMAAVELDRELQRLNDDYEAKRKGGGLDAPTVRMVPEGTFETWMRQSGRWGGQGKMPRCRSDRNVADALAALVAERTPSEPVAT